MSKKEKNDGIGVEMVTPANGDVTRIFELESCIYFPILLNTSLCRCCRFQKVG